MYNVLLFRAPILSKISLRTNNKIINKRVNDQLVLLLNRFSSMNNISNIDPFPIHYIFRWINDRFLSYFSIANGIQNSFLMSLFEPKKKKTINDKIKPFNNNRNTADKPKKEQNWNTIETILLEITAIAIIMVVIPTLWIEEKQKKITFAWLRINLSCFHWINI